MTDFDPFADFTAPDPVAPEQQQNHDEQHDVQAQPPSQEPPGAGINVPASETDPTKEEEKHDHGAAEGQDVFDSLMNDKKEDAGEDEKEKEDNMFGDTAENKVEAAAETADEYRYNELQRKYQEHLLQAEKELETAAEGLMRVASEYRAEYRASQESEIAKTAAQQEKDWEDVKQMVTDKGIGSWQKIGRLVGQGEGRVYEVLTARIAQERQEQGAEQ